MQSDEDILVAWLTARRRRREGVAIGIGDDMAELRAGSGRVLAACDMLMDGVHFDTAVHAPQQIGRKALAVNLSDCAAMAVRPRATLASVALPKTWTMRHATELFEGMEELAERYECPIVGGDTNSWDRPLVVDVTVLAEPWEGIEPARRDGARPGDVVCVTGRLGGSFGVTGSGGQGVRGSGDRGIGGSRDEGTEGRRDEGTKGSRDQGIKGSRDQGVDVSEDRGSGRPAGVGRHVTFEPRVWEARELGGRLGARLHAMMDLSDGLSTDAGRMAAASGCAIELDARAVDAVVSEAARAAARADGRTAVDHALNDGEDFELLFAVEAVDDWTLGTVRGRTSDTPITPIGRVLSGEGVWLVDGRAARTRIEPGGWRHSWGGRR